MNSQWNLKSRDQNPLTIKSLARHEILCFHFELKSHFAGQAQLKLCQYLLRYKFCCCNCMQVESTPVII